MGFDQIAIVFTGALAAWINQDQRLKVRRWAGVIGLLGQPFFFYAQWTAGQWGQFLVTACYTVAFIRGVVVGWRKEAING